jgi:hypothetical protein
VPETQVFVVNLVQPVGCRYLCDVETHSVEARCFVAESCFAAGIDLLESQHHTAGEAQLEDPEIVEDHFA